MTKNERRQSQQIPFLKKGSAMWHDAPRLLDVEDLAALEAAADYRIPPSDVPPSAVPTRLNTRKMKVSGKSVFMIQQALGKRVK